MSKDLALAMKMGMRRLVSGVSVLTTQSNAGSDYAMTVSSVTSVSDAPPSLLVCVQQSTRIAPVVKPGGYFAINVLKYVHNPVSTVCSTGDQGEHRFATGQWVRQPGSVPYLADAEAVFHCQVDALYPYGTHNIVIGKIQEVLVSTEEPEPLAYLNGRYVRVTV